MTALLILGAVLLAGAVAGWLVRAPHRVFVLVLLGGLASFLVGTTLWDQPGPFENADNGGSHAFATVIGLILWTAWSVGTVAGGLLRSLRRSTPAGDRPGSN